MNQILDYSMSQFIIRVSDDNPVTLPACMYVRTCTCIHEYIIMYLHTYMHAYIYTGIEVSYPTYSFIIDEKECWYKNFTIYLVFVQKSDGR